MRSKLLRALLSPHKPAQDYDRRFSMSNYLDKIKDRAVHPLESDAGEVDIVEYVQPSSRANGIFSFSYSYKEIASRGGKPT